MRQLTLAAVKELCTTMTLMYSSMLARHLR